MPAIVSLTGDLLTAIAQFAIPLVLFRFVLDSKFTSNAMLGWFAAFILLCGMTHLFGIAGLWWPLGALHGAVTLAAGIVGIVTLIKLLIAMPFRSAMELQNILLVREAARVGAEFRERDIRRAVKLRHLIKTLSRYADNVDLEIGGEE